MSEKITKCPVCSTKLKMINGRMTCKDCGYYLRSDNTPLSGPKPPVSGQKPPVSEPKSHTGALIGTIVTVLSVSLVASIGKTFIRNLFWNLPYDTPSKPSFSYQASYPSISLPQSFSVTTAAPNADSTPSRVIYPKSSFFVSFIEAVYDKGYRVVTPEEYAAVTYFELDDDKNTIYYRLQDGMTRTIYFNSTFGMDLEDLNCFTGLEELYLDRELFSENLDRLENLRAIHTENTLADMVKLLPHPENIQDLGIYDWTWEKNLTGIEAFPNLLDLTVDYESLEDISALSAVPCLRSLTLIDCDDLTDYSPLAALTELESLSIKSSQLKTVDFVKWMPALTALSIEDSQVTDISALSSRTSLTSLYLMDNGRIPDYSVIDGLTNLETLTVDVGYNDATPPSLKDLTWLTTLHLRNIDDLSLLRDARNVTRLTLENCDSRSLDAVTAIQGLEELYIHEFSYLTRSLTPLTQLPNLTYLDISETYIYGGIEELFGIPSLECLDLDECMIGIDFDAVPENPNLVGISMCDTRILKSPDYENTGDYDYLSAHYDFFDRFPGLTELHLDSAHLDSIDFVAGLTELQFLDITDNQVTSLKPLLQLKNFQIVWCGRNSLLETLPAGSGISVMTNERH